MGFFGAMGGALGAGAMAPHRASMSMNRAVGMPAPSLGMGGNQNASPQMGGMVGSKQPGQFGMMGGQQPQAGLPYGQQRQGPMAPRGRFGQQMGMLPQFMQQRMGQMGGQQRFVDGPGPRPGGYGQPQQMPQPQAQEAPPQMGEGGQEQFGQKPAMQGGEAPPWMQSMQGGMGPQQSKLQQMMQRFQQRPQPVMVNNGWGKMIPREQAEAFRLGGGVA